MGSKRKTTSRRRASNRVDVWFATNRDPNRKRDPDDFGGDFNDASVDSLRFGIATVSVRGSRAEVQSVRVADEKLTGEPDTQVLGSRSVFEQLRANMKRCIDTIVFVHGYNVSFREALESGARLARQHECSVVVFSWPSDGKMTPLLAYKRDRTDAMASAPALARAMLKLRDFVGDIEPDQACAAKMHLMAHSMGNYVLRHGLQEALRFGGLPRLFHQIFLLAADEDDDAFERDDKLRPLPRLGDAVSIYFNQGDTALAISDRTKNNPTRLGSQGPQQPLNVPANVYNIDVSGVVHGAIEHSYFLDNAKVMLDMARVMRGEAQDRIRGRRYAPSQNRFVLASRS